MNVAIPPTKLNARCIDESDAEGGYRLPVTKLQVGCLLFLSEFRIFQPYAYAYPILSYPLLLLLIVQDEGRVENGQH